MPKYSKEFLDRQEFEAGYEQFFKDKQRRKGYI